MSQVVAFPEPGRNPDAFTRDLFAWLNQVKADAELPASAFKVAFELGQHANRAQFRKTGKLVAWPSLTTIAGGIGMSERTVRDMAQRLAKRHLAVAIGRGPGNPSIYTMTTENRQPAAAYGERKPAGYDSETGRELPHKTGSLLPTNHLSPSEEPSDRRRKAAEPSDGCSTVDGSRGSRLDGAPPSQAPNREPQSFRVGGWRRNASGDHYEVLAVDVEAHTVTVRFTETGIEQTTKAPAGAVLIPCDDDLDDEIPF
ncbi:helix-turn-helix domain-containing protein [Mesorhizobium sp. Z1-4]|uniref:helix-turn-helix domain-containing protein n=1 Tax=Mesorhizobium sp. Z1-4 TaxID=2448478 RepID=UPI000FDAD59A|nr:helix-turn-helix domain-containing protein [Mesorhizobium sp. Z1-4]